VEFATGNGDYCYYRRWSLLSVAAIATGDGSLLPVAAAIATRGGGH
jgi:hypothetical protein